MRDRRHAKLENILLVRKFMKRISGEMALRSRERKQQMRNIQEESKNLIEVEYLFQSALQLLSQTLEAPIRSLFTRLCKKFLPCKEILFRFAIREILMRNRGNGEEGEMQ